MPTVLDAFVVELGLDPKKFTDGQRAVMDSFKKSRKEAEQEANAAEREAKRVADSIAKIRGEVIGLVSSFLGASAIKSFVSNLAVADAQLGRTADLVGVNAKELGAWQAVAERTGGTAAGLTSTINSVVQEFQNLQHGLPSSAPPFLNALNNDAQKLGLTSVNLIKAFSSGKPTEFLLQLSQVLSKLSGPEAAFAGSKLGLDANTVSLLRRGRTELEALVADAAKLGGVTDAGVAANQKFMESFNRLGEAVFGVGRDLENYVIGPLTKFNNGAADWILNNRKVADGIGAIGAAIAGLIALKPAAWILRAIGLGGLLSSGPVAAVAGLVIPTNKSDEPDLIRKNPVTGKYEATEFGRSLGAGGASLRTKAGAGVASDPVERLAEMLQNSIPGLNRFTSFNDQFHAGTDSAHAKGRALDFTLNNPWQYASTAEAIRAKLRALGVDATVLDEKNHPSTNATAPHIHVQFQTSEAAAAFAAAMRTAPSPGNLPASAPGAAGVSNTFNRPTSNNSEVKIDNIEIHTPENNAPGIAKEIHGALRQRTLAINANYGLA